MKQLQLLSLPENDFFENWWKSYPRKVAKLAARRAYDLAIRRGATHEQLLMGAVQYAAERSGQDERYTAHGASWINAGRWMDVAPVQTRGTVFDVLGELER